MLSFFYELDSQRWGCNLDDKGCARVYWFPDLQFLHPMDSPMDLLDRNRLPDVEIQMTARPTLPQWEDADYYFMDEDSIDGEQIERVNAFIYRKWGLPENADFSKLLGWPRLIQNNATFDCELVHRGVDSDSLTKKEILSLVEELSFSVEDWQ